MSPETENASTPNVVAARSRKQATPASGKTTTRQVLAALAHDERARSEVMAAFKLAGGALVRWQTADKTIMCGLLTTAEDAAETRLHGKWTAAREALRAVRRQLECEVYP